jgi:hypothetical protein
MSSARIFPSRLKPQAFVALVFLACGPLFSAAAHAGDARLHRFTVAPNVELTELSVRACFDGAPPAALVAESLDASLALIEAHVEGDKGTIEPSGSLSLKSVPDNGCLRYRVDVSRPIKVHDRSGEKIRRVGRDLVTAAGIWLWRPETLAAGEDVELVFDLPAGVSVSAPWQPVAGAALPSFLLGRTPYQWPAAVAFGRFQERVLSVGGAKLRLAVLDGTPPVDEARMAEWIADAAQMVSDLYGHFPFPHAQVVLVPNARGNEPTPWAYVVRGGSPAVHLFINQRRPLQEFFDDWTATHELSHLLLPFIDQDDAWLSEGVATYYQNILRARAGRLTPQQAWSRMHAGFQRGRDDAPGMTLAQATENMYRGSSFMRVYWEGTAIMLLADTRLRQLTAGKQSVDTALAALHRCCMQPERLWTARELFERLDEITGTHVFSELHAAHVSSKDFPDLSGTYRALGLVPGPDGVELLPDAPHAQMRDAIMQGGALFLSDRLAE